MKALLSSFLFLLVAGGSAAQTEIFTAPPPAEVQQPDTNGVYVVTDQPAEFPGGKEQLYKFLGENLQFPEIAIRKKWEGKCFLRFVVSESGRISDVKVVKGTPNCIPCDEEAVRVVRSMPDWVPAKNKGKNVKSYFTLPITFKLT